MEIANRIRSLSLFIVFSLIAIGLAIAYKHASVNNFLPCEYECGETILSEFEARNFRLFGAKFGLLEDLATSPSVDAHPQYYTHNVNIGALSFVLMEYLGISNFSTKQTIIIGIWALGLLYAYLSISYFTKNKFCGIIAVAFLITDFAFSQTYTAHALRTWEWLPIFALPYYAVKFLNKPCFYNAFMCFVMLCVAFGVGYDFWVTMTLCSGIMMSLAYAKFEHKSYKIFICRMFIFGSIVMAPFILRQIHVLLVMGYEYWHIDFYNTIGIKIPFINKLISVPEISDLDAWYAKYNVLRPPAAPLNAKALLTSIILAINSFKNVILPGAGLITVIFTFASILACCILFIRDVAGWIKKDKFGFVKSNILEIDVYHITSYIFAMCVGYCLGFLITPSVSVLYLLMASPLLIAPFTAAKSMFIVLAIYSFSNSLRLKNIRSTIAYSIIIVGLFLDQIILQYFNIKYLKPMDTSWIPVVKRLSNSTFAVPYIQQSTSAFSNNWSIHVKGQGVTFKYFDAIKNKEQPFSKDDLIFFGEKEGGSLNIDYTRPDYFLYYTIDHRITMFDPEPECRRDYLTSLLRELTYPAKESYNIKKVRFSYGVYNNKPVFSVTGKTNIPYEKIDSIYLKMSNEEPQKLVYNCFKSSFSGVVTLPDNIGDTKDAEIIFTKDDELVSAYPITIDIQYDQENILNPPKVRQATVKEVIERYPDLNIVDYKLSDKSYLGYILIDLRDLYRKN